MAKGEVKEAELGEQERQHYLLGLLPGRPVSLWRGCRGLGMGQTPVGPQPGKLFSGRRVGEMDIWTEARQNKEVAVS